MSRYADALSPCTDQRRWDAPCTVGVISDTHIYEGSKRSISESVFDVFRRARIDVLVHLGDANSRTVLDQCAEVAPLIAVPGNNDDDDLQWLLPEKVRFDVGRYSIGAVHGHGGRSARDMALRTWGDRVDLVLYGHSHKPIIERVGKSILFNPGSATDRRWFPHFGIGLIRITDDAIQPDLVLFTDPAHLVNVEV